MFSHTSLVGHVIHVHLAEASLSATTSFMRGTFVFDPASHTSGSANSLRFSCPRAGI